jgi:diaminopimelate decarboxylase
LRLHGLHVHLGSQLFDQPPYVQAIDVLLDCAARLRDEHNILIEAISPGGGLGVPYTAGQTAPDLAAYGRALGQALEAGCAARGLPLPTLIVEPGRSIVARAGVALYSIIARKFKPGSIAECRLQIAEGDSNLQSTICNLQYLHVDGGMADNIRPALYEARYTALLANRADDAATTRVHVAGRFCESGDVLMRDVLLPAARPGDLLAVAVAGAYTLSMASNYNLVPRPAVLLLNHGTARVIQRRETYEDLVRRDKSL